MEFVNFDHQRKERVAVPEAVFSEGKPETTLLEMLRKFSMPEAEPVLFTRLKEKVFSKLQENIQSLYSYDNVSCTAFAKKVSTPIKGTVAVVSAGTADTAVALECARTLEFMNVEHKFFADCGVAGLWRIQKHIEEINTYSIIVCIAGLEGALASVLAGLTPRPIIGCPTSVGYGICDHGKTALNSMLACCSPGISVVNIDNGFGAASTAYKTLLSFQGQL
ncbi:MAG: nickel pincer cofactor biosynthesis protein LarB [Burkholderiales bacterium]|nr:nickel pincer cofactor biosynthesis protein LarB [Burkholderiales bacterium]